MWMYNTNQVFDLYETKRKNVKFILEQDLRTKKETK